MCSLYVCLWRDYTRIHVYTYIRIYIDCNPYMRRQTYKLEIHIVGVNLFLMSLYAYTHIRIYAYTHLYLSNLKQFSQIEIHYTFRQTIHVTHSLPISGRRIDWFFPCICGCFLNGEKACDVTFPIGTRRGSTFVQS